MELTVQVGFNELVQAIKKLSPEELRNLQEILQSSSLYTQSGQERKFGTMKGLINHMADDFDAPINDFNDYQ